MKAQTAVSRKSQALGPLFAQPEDDDLSSYGQRQFIGVLGLILPGLLWLIAGWRPTEGLPRWEPLGSVSAYYYSGTVAAFVGILVTLGVFLFTYRGYNNRRIRDRVAALVAGSAAVLVAFFPAGAPGELPVPSWWTPQTARIHYVSAGILLCTFCYFCFVLFPQSKVKRGPLPPDKQARNWIYFLCGIVIAACIVWAGSAYFTTNAQIFWPETLALESFAVSWLVKGRVDKTALAVGRRTLYYGSRPGELAGEIRAAIRR